MNTILAFALHVISALLVQSDASFILPCPRTCTADKQVLLCDKVNNADIVALVKCIGDIPDTIVVMLAGTGLECDCAFDDFLARLDDVNIVVFHDVTCTIDIIATCRYGNFNIANASLSYVPLLDDVIDVRMANWREKFDGHYLRLWSILSRLNDPDVRNLYLARLRKTSQRAEGRLLKLWAQSFPTEFDENRLSLQNGISANMTRLQEMDEKLSAASGKLMKVIIFSCVVGLVFILVLIALLCKLECERRMMGSDTNTEDSCLDSKLKTRLNSVRSFLEKLSCYRKLKAEMGGADKETTPLVARQVIIDQTSVPAAGTVVAQDSRSSVVVSSMSRLVSQQPEDADGELEPSRSGQQVEDDTTQRENTQAQKMPVEDKSMSRENTQTEN